METEVKTSTFCPVSLTPNALVAVRKLMGEKELAEDFGLRVGVNGGGCSGMTYVLGFDSKTEFDEEYVIDEIPLLIDRRQLLFVLGTEIDFEARANGFYLHKPAIL